MMKHWWCWYCKRQGLTQCAVWMIGCTTRFPNHQDTLPTKQWLRADVRNNFGNFDSLPWHNKLRWHPGKYWLEFLICEKLFINSMLGCFCFGILTLLVLTMCWQCWWQCVGYVLVTWSWETHSVIAAPLSGLSPCLFFTRLQITWFFLRKSLLAVAKKLVRNLSRVVCSASSVRSWWPAGGCRPTDVARNSSAGAPTGGPRWSGGQVVVPLPLYPAAGGRLREFWWHNGATLQCRSKRAHAEDGERRGTCVQLEQEQQLPLLGCRLPDQKISQADFFANATGESFEVESDLTGM